MSRIGKKPIDIVDGVSVDVNGSTVVVSGKLGSLTSDFPKEVLIEKKENQLQVSPKVDSKKARAMWGLTRTLVSNMVIGVSEGFTKKLEIHGVGYKSSVDNKYLTLNLGFSHEIKFEIPNGITIKAEKPTLLSISGIDKQKVGEVASEIVKQRPPEPYKGKGVRYEGQHILRKEGKKK